MALRSNCGRAYRSEFLLEGIPDDEAKKSVRATGSAARSRVGRFHAWGMRCVACWLCVTGNLPSGGAQTDADRWRDVNDRANIKFSVYRIALTGSAPGVANFTSAGRSITVYNGGAQYPANGSAADIDVMRVPLISVALRGGSIYVTDALGGRILKLRQGFGLTSAADHGRAAWPWLRMAESGPVATIAG